MAEDHLQELAVSDEMGDALFKAGRYGGAVAAFRKCVKIRELLAATDPGDIKCRRELAVSHAKLGDALVGDAGAWNVNMRNTRVAPERLAGALAAYRKSEMILENIAAANPANAGLQRDLSVTYDKIGDILLVTGKLDEALASYRKDLAIAIHLAATHPENLDYLRDALVSYDRIGDALVATGQVGEAIAAYRMKSAIIQKLGALDPEIDEKIGDLLRRAGRTDEALAAYRRSLVIFEQMAARDPVNSASWQARLSDCRAKFDDTLAAEGRPKQELAAHRSMPASASPASLQTEATKSIKNLSGQIRGDTSVAGLDVRRRKGLGIASFIVGLICFFLWVALGENLPVLLAHNYRAIESALISFCFLNLIGVALGIAGVLDRTASKTFAIFGIVIGGVMLAIGGTSLMLTIWPVQTSPW